MRYLSVILLAIALAPTAFCADRQFHDVYRTARLSAAHPDGSAFRVGLQFVRVETDATAVCRWWNPFLHRWQEYRASRGEYFHDTHGNIDLTLVAASVRKQEITVKYLYQTDRPTL